MLELNVDFLAKSNTISYRQIMTIQFIARVKKFKKGTV